MERQAPGGLLVPSATLLASSALRGHGVGRSEPGLRFACCAPGTVSSAWHGAGPPLLLLLPSLLQRRLLLHGCMACMGSWLADGSSVLPRSWRYGRAWHCCTIKGRRIASMAAPCILSQTMLASQPFACLRSQT